MIYSIPFKFFSSLPNQRCPSPLFTPINPLGLLPDFLISSPCLPLVTAFYRVPLKSPVPNFIALGTKHLASPAFTTKFPFCSSLCWVLWPSYFLPYKLLPAIRNYISIPLTHPHISNMGDHIRSRRIKNLKKLRVIFFIISPPQLRAVYDMGLRPLDFWDCGFESVRKHGCLSVSVTCCQVEFSA